MIILILIAFSLSKDLILIGDSRIKEMANVIFEIENSYYASGYLPYHSPMTTEPVSYEDYNIHVTAPEKIDHIFTGAPNDSVHFQLKSAKPGTNVLLNLGIDNLNLLDDIIIFYGKLADKYYKLNFYIISLIGVDETKIDISNSRVKEFNAYIKNRILEVEFDNLKYKNILKGEDPTQIMIDDEPVDILKYSTDGIGFYRNGLTRIFKAMVEGLEFES